MLKREYFNDTHRVWHIEDGPTLKKILSHDINDKTNGLIFTISNYDVFNSRVTQVEFFVMKITERNGSECPDQLLISGCIKVDDILIYADHFWYNCKRINHNGGGMVNFFGDEEFYKPRLIKRYDGWMEKIK